MTLSRYEHAPKLRDRAILKCLGEANGELTTKQIAERCGYSPQATFHHLERLRSLRKVFRRELRSGTVFVWSAVRQARAA